MHAMAGATVTHEMVYAREAAEPTGIYPTWQEQTWTSVQDAQPGQQLLEKQPVHDACIG